MKKILSTLLIILAILKTEAQTSVFDIVETHMNKGDYQSAISVLEKVQTKTDKEYAKLGSIYQSVGNYTKAIENYKLALETSKDNSVRFKLGQAYNSAGLTNNSLKTFQEVLEVDSTYVLAATQLGKMYVSKNRLKDAEKIYTFLKTKDPQNPEYPYRLGKVLEKQKRFFEMGESYLESYRIDSLHIRSIYGLAKFYKKLKFKDSTALFLNKGLQIDSLNTQFLQFKANELYVAKNFEECLIYLDKLESQHYKTMNSLEMKGMCHYNLKNFEAAEEAFSDALRIEANSQILYRLASLYYDQKNIKRAELFLRMSISNGMGDLDKQYYLKGIIFKEKGDLKIALESFKEAYRYNSNNYKALFEVATISDTYYEDKKIALQNYDRFVKRFEDRDSEMTSYAKNRIKEINRELFIKADSIEE